jgi:4-amino-4-deoxy-L-arabinose transferase-like glycosyltransferase
VTTTIPLGGDPGAAARPPNPSVDALSDAPPDAGDAEDEAGRAARHFWPWLLSIATLALIIRVTYVLVVTSRTKPKILYDAFYYTIESVYLSKGHFFPVLFGTAPDATHPPLTSLSLVPATYFWGISSQIPQQMTMAILGVAVVVLVGLLGRAVAGPWVGLAAAVLAAVYPNFWVPNGIVMSETLSMLLMVLILLATYALLRHPTWTNAALLGLACGLEILVRAELVLFIPFLLVPAALARRELRWRRGLALAGVGTLVCLVSVMPWVGRNLASFRDTTLISTNEGLLLVGANCPATYAGNELGFWSIECGVAVKAHGDPSQVGAADQHEAITYAKHHIGRLPVVVAARVGRMWDLYRPVQMAQIDVNEGRPEWAGLAGLGMYYALLPVAALGIVSLRRRRITLWPLLVPAGVLTAVAALTYGLVRFRAPFEVCLVVLAAVGMAAIRNWFARSRAAAASGVVDGPDGPRATIPIAAPPR